MKSLMAIVRHDLETRAAACKLARSASIEVDPVPVPDCDTLHAMQAAIQTLITIHCPIL
jgi:O-succinylbenzoate synthase